MSFSILQTLKLCWTEETSAKSIDQATSKSVDEVDQYQVEGTDQLNEDQEDDSPTDVEPNADIDQPERGSTSSRPTLIFVYSIELTEL